MPEGQTWSHLDYPFVFLKKIIKKKGPNLKPGRCDEMIQYTWSALVSQALHKDNALLDIKHSVDTLYTKSKSGFISNNLKENGFGFGPPLFSETHLTILKNYLIVS